MTFNMFKSLTLISILCTTALGDNLCGLLAAMLNMHYLYSLIINDLPLSLHFSRSDMIKVGSSCHTSGDELETTTSSDIEIISRYLIYIPYVEFSNLKYKFDVQMILL